ncbi:MAG TPA: hypothetical protein VGR81_09680 [Candidatus Acidoferrales bacterium]|nr:hypothetical protein [Candidatus Acidoferrales bacterium]
MANWRQIQGRIRRARTSGDPVAKLTELFQKTRDAMVAFEVGSLEEKAGHNDEAIRWFKAAAERFRRADWKKKAADALTRLGAAVPEGLSARAAVSTEATEHAANEGGESLVEEEDVQNSEMMGNLETEKLGVNLEPEVIHEDPQDQIFNREQPPSAVARAASQRQPATERRGRRRGRRGGRRHKRHGEAGKPGMERPTVTPARPPVERTSRSGMDERVYAQSGRQSPAAQISASAPVETPESAATPASRFVPEPSGPFVERTTFIRAGDPALASRFAQLESLLRRLISAPLHRIDEIAEAPAGPGVFLLSDSDLMTNYYVEACQTLRIGTSQLARAGRAGRGARAEGKASLRAQLAEHLEINDTQVNDYLKKHCVVRWLQLDEDAPHVAHFAIAVLRPALNTQ